MAESLMTKVSVAKPTTSVKSSKTTPSPTSPIPACKSTFTHSFFPRIAFLPFWFKPIEFQRQVSSHHLALQSHPRVSATPFFLAPAFFLTTFLLLAAFLSAAGDEDLQNLLLLEQITSNCNVF
jgi:hypothetical protein